MAWRKENGFWRKKMAAFSFSERSNWESTFSIPPTCMEMAPAKKYWVAPFVTLPGAMR
jgi:hypothetical protein